LTGFPMADSNQSDLPDEGIERSGPPPLPPVDERVQVERRALDEYPEDRPRRRRRRDDFEPDIALAENLGDNAGMRMLLPVGRSPWAIVSGYLGLLSILFVPAPLALITGIIAIVHMRMNPKMHGMGRAIFGIIMGTLGTIGLIGAFVAIVLRK